MLTSITLAVAAFALTLVGLFYDSEERRFRLSVWDAENRRLRDPGPAGRIVLAVGAAVFAMSVAKGIADSIVTARAIAEAKHQQLRMTTLIGDPELILVSDFPVSTIRAQAETHPDVAIKLNQLFLMVKETPIPPDNCGGIVLSLGPGAIAGFGDVLLSEGGLSAVDFLLNLGFYVDGKDISSFAKSGFEMFDMFMSANFDEPQAELTYFRAEDKFRLVIADEVDGFSADPATIASRADLLGAVGVLEPGNANSAYKRGYVQWLVVRDRGNKGEFVINLSDLAPAAADSGWPTDTMLGTLGPAEKPCLPELGPDSR
jgi:hypothetical protein